MTGGPVGAGREDHHRVEVEAGLIRGDEDVAVLTSWIGDRAHGLVLSGRQAGGPRPGERGGAPLEAEGRRGRGGHGEASSPQCGAVRRPAEPASGPRRGGMGARGPIRASPRGPPAARTAARLRQRPPCKALASRPRRGRGATGRGSWRGQSGRSPRQGLGGRGAGSLFTSPRCLWHHGPPSHPPGAARLAPAARMAAAARAAALASSVLQLLGRPPPVVVLIEDLGSASEHPVGQAVAWLDDLVDHAHVVGGSAAALLG